jgi:hypothetical protein
MAITTIRASQVVSAGLGLLRRERVLGGLVWRVAAGDFTGSLNDTISIRVPAYAKARTRALRSGTTRVRDSLAETKVDVTLDTDVYKDVKISDEELTLDIANFGEQVLNPLMAGVADTIEDAIIAEMTNATYAKTLAFSYSGNAWTDLIVPARELLNNARVPQAGRILAVGSGIETEMLSTDLFVKANESGSTTALEEATLGRKAGFTIVSVPGLDPDEAYAFHATAFPLVGRAPVVPAGAPWGAVMSYDGYAIRAVRVLDSDEIVDVLALDSWVGTGVAKDTGYFNADDQFTPSDEAAGTAQAVTGEADDETFAATAHGYEAGDRVVFTSLTGGAGLSTNREYYVIASGLTANAFKVSATLGGSAVNFTTDVTAGTVRSAGHEVLARAIKITAS